jgi:hypothetical protein
MPEYVAEAFAVMVHVYGDDEHPLREEYVVGCSTREAAEDRIKRYFPPGIEIRVFALSLSASETAALNLLPDEVRQRSL